MWQLHLVSLTWGGQEKIDNLAIAQWYQALGFYALDLGASGALWCAAQFNWFAVDRQ